ncbi:hypothetical protein [Paenibacillus caui]|uniref:hypothetical protein n=1 Tax=Paenibacillus caui TaxID=2873927 RepID=UPI001CA8F9F9|nr:hypothetical protein [Paenibacillus caui]
MLGMLFNDKECRELDYLLRKELDEMLLDLSDNRLDHDIRSAIAKRYTTVFRMYARFAPPKELSKYARRHGFRRPNHNGVNG